MNVDLVWSTPNGEDLIAYMARVSNPENEHNPEYIKLLRYLMKNKHWSPFEMAHMCVRIETSRAIAAQILRHRSFSFQEYSQRYSEVTDFEPIELRRQATKNRQSSTEVFEPYIETDKGNADAPALQVIDDYLTRGKFIYDDLIAAGVAKESARFILPATTRTTMYMAGSIRSWLHYIELRDEEHVQKEHRRIAQQIRDIFNQYFPTVAEALAQLKKEREDKDYLYKLLMEGKIQLP